MARVSSSLPARTSRSTSTASTIGGSRLSPSSSEAASPRDRARGRAARQSRRRSSSARWSSYARSAFPRPAAPGRRRALRGGVAGDAPSLPPDRAVVALADPRRGGVPRRGRRAATLARCGSRARALGVHGGAALRGPSRARDRAGRGHARGDVARPPRGSRSSRGSRAAAAARGAGERPASLTAKVRFRV